MLAAAVVRAARARGLDLDAARATSRRCPVTACAAGRRAHGRGRQGQLDPRRHLRRRWARRAPPGRARRRADGLRPGRRRRRSGRCCWTTRSAPTRHARSASCAATASAASSWSPATATRRRRPSARSSASTRSSPNARRPRRSTRSALERGRARRSWSATASTTRPRLRSPTSASPSAPAAHRVVGGRRRRAHRRPARSARRSDRHRPPRAPHRARERPRRHRPVARRHGRRRLRLPAAGRGALLQELIDVAVILNALRGLAGHHVGEPAARRRSCSRAAIQRRARTLRPDVARLRAVADHLDAGRTAESLAGCGRSTGSWSTSSTRTNRPRTHVSTRSSPASSAATTRPPR